MKIIKLEKSELNETNLNIVSDVIKKGGLVVFPSDTVYGLLADATNKEAVGKLIAFKERPPGKPISIFVSDFKMLIEYVKIKEDQLLLLKQLLPGPFTIVLDSRHQTVKLLESEKGTLGVRIPDFKFITDLVYQLDKPVTATSANLSNRPPHYQIETLLEELPKQKKDLLDLIIDIGKLPRNKPSTVIDLTEPKMKIIREGDIIDLNKKVYVSTSPLQTKKIAQEVLKKNSSDLDKPLVFIIEGELGSGKTVFAQGLGEGLGIGNVISPSYVIYYEYDIKNSHFKKFVHFDLYNIQEAEELKHLGIENYLKRENILVFEWGEKAGEIYEGLRRRAKIVRVRLEYLDEKSRRVIVNY